VAGQELRFNGDIAGPEMAEKAHPGRGRPGLEAQSGLLRTWYPIRRGEALPRPYEDAGLKPALQILTMSQRPNKLLQADANI
jgi:hypothetical protein